MTKAATHETATPAFARRLASPSLIAPPELRNAARAMLMLRSAKLICQSGEYVCLLRDVSSSGVRLRLFHPLPPETCFFLEMASGANYAIENRWCIGDQAGFRFVQPIDVYAFTDECGDYPRRPLRLRLEHHGQLICQGRAAPMVLRDISQSGAKIETRLALALHQTVKLAFGGISDCFAQVRWRNGSDHGLAFVHGFSLADLAALAKTLQPFQAQPSLAAPDTGPSPVPAKG